MFRFEELVIWKSAVGLGIQLCELADELEASKGHRFAEQMRGAALSSSKNIAGGSGSLLKKEFQRHLAIAPNSIFEKTSMLLFFTANRDFDRSERLSEIDDLLFALDRLSAQVTTFSRTLNS